MNGGKWSLERYEGKKRGAEEERERKDSKERVKEGKGIERKGREGRHFSLERKEVEEVVDNVLRFLGEVKASYLKIWDFWRHDEELEQH